MILAFGVTFTADGVVVTAAPAPLHTGVTSLLRGNVSVVGTGNTVAFVSADAHVVRNVDSNP